MTNPITFPREGGCVYFREGCLFGIICADGFQEPARAGGKPATEKKGMPTWQSK